MIHDIFQKQYMMKFEELVNLLLEDRSVRRFDESKPIPEEILEKLVALIRLCASGRNLQPLRYRIVTQEEERSAVFPALKWAGYLSDWDGPEKGERPTAYLIQCLDEGLTQNLLCDDGIQLQALTLGATSLGLRGCIIKSFNMAIIREQLNLPEKVKPLYVLALGYPVEKVVIDDMKDDDVKYWRDAEGVHHVPKRRAEELIIR